MSTKTTHKNARDNTRDISLAATAFAAALALAAPARAAVIQSGPAVAYFAGDLAYVPASQGGGLAFDGSLGTLNSVTLSFSGTLNVFGGGRTADPPLDGAGVIADVTAVYGLRTGPTAPGVSLAPVEASARVTQPPAGSPSGSLPAVGVSATAAREFAVTIAAADYDTASLRLETRLRGLTLVSSVSPPDAVFRGTASALFDYVPIGGEGGGGAAGGGTSTPVPEPAPWAALGVGLLGLAAMRRRAT